MARLSTGKVGLAEAIQAALVHESTLHDRLLLANRKQLARQEPLRALNELVDLDGQLLREARRRARACAEREAALILTTKFSRRTSYDAVRVRQRIVSSRTSLLKMLDCIDGQRAILREEAISVLEGHMGPMMKRIRTLRQRLQANRSKAEDLSKSAGSQAGKGLRNVKTHHIAALVRNDQNELLLAENKLRELEGITLTTFKQPSAILCGSGLVSLDQSLFAAPKLAVSRLQAIARAAERAAKGDFDGVAWNVALSKGQGSDDGATNNGRAWTTAQWQVGERRRLAAIRARRAVAW